MIPRSKPGERRERADIGGRERDRIHAHAQKLILWETGDCISAIFTDHFFVYASIINGRNITRSKFMEI